MNDSELNKEIDDYLLGRLSQEAAKDLEERASKNEDLSERIKQYRAEHLVMETLVEKDFRADMSRWERKRKRRRLLSFLLLPVTVLLLAWLAWQYLDFRSSSSAPNGEVNPVIDSTNTLKDSIESKEVPPTPPSSEEGGKTKPSKEKAVASLAPSFEEKQRFVRLWFQMYPPLASGNLMGNDPDSLTSDTISTAILQLEKKDTSGAIFLLKQVRPNSDVYLSAQEILADIFFTQKSLTDAEGILVNLSAYENLSLGTRARWNLLLLLYLSEKAEDKVRYDSLEQLIRSVKPRDKYLDLLETIPTAVEK